MQEESQNAVEGGRFSLFLFYANRLIFRFYSAGKNNL
jgi:hypothetical protein